MVKVESATDAEQNILGGCYLVRTHNHEILIDGENAEARKYV